MRFLTISLAVALAGCGADTTPTGPGHGDTTISYKRDVRPIFAVKCTRCHFEGAPEPRVNLEDPFDPERGVVGLPNTYPDAPTQILVVPGKPEESFLIEKLTRKDLDHATEGDPMPRQIAPLSADELATVQTWIMNGAADDDLYRSKVKTLFHDRCHDCHNANAPIEPNLDAPFTAHGVVGVRASVGGVRVEPKHPEESVLYRKVSGAALPVQLGAPMPYHIAPLSDAEVQIISMWIEEGAEDN
jgi:hypothetical protein